MRQWEEVTCKAEQVYGELHLEGPSVNRIRGEACVQAIEGQEEILSMTPNNLGQDFAK